MLSAIRSAARYAIENRRTFSEPSARFVPSIRVLHDVDLAEEEEKHLTERTPDRQRIRITRANEQMPVTNKFPFSRLRKEKLRAAQIPMRHAYVCIYTYTYLRILDAVGKKIHTVAYAYPLHDARTRSLEYIITLRAAARWWASERA
jgi:hypothetical protein